MACKKSELVSAINSFGAARASGDNNLQTFAAQLVGQYIETLEFAEEDPEEEEVVEESDAE
jgi:hypothetical protein